MARPTSSWTALTARRRRRWNVSSNPSTRISRPGRRNSAPHRELRFMNKADRLRVELGARGYDILIGPGLIAEAGRHLKPLLRDGRAFVVTDERVATLHLPM